MLANAQAPGGMPGGMKNMKDPKMGRVYGKVLDSKTNEPVEYASIQVLWYNKDSLIGGTLVKSNGDFSVDGLPSFGQVRVKIKFIGYKDYLQKVYLTPPDKLEQDLGNIKLAVDDQLLKEVDVVAEKSAVVLGIDKRVYNVEKDLSIKGGTAIDVMKNIPGLTVDADGGVQLRNQSPTIFIDGRPTTLTLQQIPADQIERVEIITNPSVKYDASSSGGILNITLKKNTKPGYNGMVMGGIGTGDRYNGVVNLNVKEGKWNLSMMYTYNTASNLNKGYTYRTNLNDTINHQFNQNSESRTRNQFNFGRIGIDYNINNRNTITISENIVAGQFKTHDSQIYDMFDIKNNEISNGDRINDQWSEFKNFTTQLQYKKTFPKAGKELTMDLNNNISMGSNGYLFLTSGYIPGSSSVTVLPKVYQKNDGVFNASQYVAQMDFTNPLTENSKLEFGLKYYFKQSLTTNITYNSVNDESNYKRDSIMSNNYSIDDNINAAYINYNNKLFWGINYQAGLRFEQSAYTGNILDKQLSFSYNYPIRPEDIMKALFPGIYFSKKLKKNQEVQLNFSRKIDRPNYFQLMPVVMFSDKQNIRIGNPQLKPEFRNISELNYNKILSKGSYLASIYFRYEEQPITNVAYPSDADPNVLVNTSVNGKNSIKYGLENTLKYSLFKNFDATLNINVFYIYLQGTIIQNQPDVTAEGYAYNAKVNLSYKFPKQLTLQVNGNYDSPKVLLQGKSKEVYSMDVSVNKMIGTKWIFNLSLNDAFNTRRMGFLYDTPTYTQELSRRRESRYAKFSITYLFGKMDASIFKKAKQMKGTSQEQGNMDGF